MQTTASSPSPVTLELEPRAAARSLVVVSNRLPFTAERSRDEIVFTRSSGGLVAALDPVLSARGGVWIGWPGVEQEPGEPDDALVPPPGPRIRYRPVRYWATGDSAAFLALQATQMQSQGSQFDSGSSSAGSFDSGGGGGGGGGFDSGGGFGGGDSGGGGASSGY